MSLNREDNYDNSKLEYKGIGTLKRAATRKLSTKTEGKSPYDARDENF